MADQIAAMVASALGEQAAAPAEPAKTAAPEPEPAPVPASVRPSNPHFIHILLFYWFFFHSLLLVLLSIITISASFGFL